MDNEKKTEKQNKINHHGNLNPHFGKPHSVEAKQKISASQKERYQQYKNAMNGIHHTTMDELLSNESFNKRIEKVIKESLIKLLKK